MKKLELFLLTIFLALYVFTANAQNNGVVYVGSIKSNKYHKFTCRFVKKIEPRYRIFFTPEEFIKLGYVPCRWLIRFAEVSIHDD